MTCDNLHKDTILLATYVYFRPSLGVQLTWHAFEDGAATIKQQRSFLATDFKRVTATGVSPTEFYERRISQIEQAAKEGRNARDDEAYGAKAAQQAIQRFLCANPTIEFEPGDILVHGVNVVKGYVFIRTIRIDLDLIDSLMSGQRDAVDHASRNVKDFIEKMQVREKYLMQ